MVKQVCRGECLFGKCPYDQCIKHQSSGRAITKKPMESMEVLTAGTISIEDSNRKGYGLAIDIGTTTIAALLYNLNNSHLLASVGELNEQVSYGPDVISRIKFCGDNSNGLALLNHTIINQLNNIVSALCLKADISSDNITYCVITGNTTMMHLVTNLSPVSMGVMPFEPLSYYGKVQPGMELGLDLMNATVYLPPCNSAFVGGDITCDMLYAGFSEMGQPRLLVDIGTNGEVALLHDGKILSSSTAAGPAFEGAHISCGLAGVQGAINRIDVLQGEIQYSTIGNQAARGLCGSGLLDAIALFVETGAIDKSGRIVGDDGKYVMQVDGKNALCITDGVYITQRDIREVQNAKSAIYGGILTLMHEAGIEASDLGTIFIAGGFGNYMDIISARTVGLIPESVETVSLGNGAAAGATMLLFNEHYVKDIEKIQDISTHVELGNNPFFMEKYIDCMYF